MDFLDPRIRRAHSIRLITGYALMAIVIVLGAYLLVNAANGYGIDTKTGQIIQNGLLFVDSQPSGAKVFLDGKAQGATTSSRLILPAGKYSLSLQKDGYRAWSRSFTLNEHSVERYVYPFLFPVNLKSTALKNYTAKPSFTTQSPDRRWLLLTTPDTTSSSVTFDQFDTTNLKKAPKRLTLPSGLLSATKNGRSSLKEVEWSTDNKHVLLLHSYGGGKEFIIFNRDSPTTSININKLLKVAPSEVALRNKKIDQVYIFNQKSGELQIGDTRNSKTTPLLKNVLAFKSFGADILNYVSDKNSAPGEASAYIWDGRKSYPLYSFSKGTNYLIDEAQFQGHFYFVAGSDTDERVNIFKDPLSSIKNPSVGKAIPLISLNVKNGQKVSFSANARFVEAEAGQSFAVYDFETQSIFHYTIASQPDGLLHWMDGHRLIGTVKGITFVTDYDSTNQQTLVASVYPIGGYFDQPYKRMFTFQNKSGGGITLMNVSLLAGTDAPKSSQ